MGFKLVYLGMVDKQRTETTNFRFFDVFWLLGLLGHYKQYPKVSLSSISLCAVYAESASDLTKYMFDCVL